MPDLNASEEEILGYWKEHGIMEMVREKNRGGKPFYFLDGPPFVSGDLHPGQMWVKSMKDVELRYRRFRGFDVYDRAGYDVHGLPIEKKVEAKLQVRSKKEIETRIGIGEFIRNCKEYVNAYIGRMDADYERFGISLDFSNPYIPSTRQYMETEWGMLKRIYEKGLLYKGLRSTPYCTSCETAVSQGSTEVEYRDDEDPSLYIAYKAIPSTSSKAKLRGEIYLLIWTTTPWTLPANMAVAANPKELYALAKIGKRRYIMMKSRLDDISKMLGESAIVEGEFYGSELQGLGYVSPLEGKIPKQKEFGAYHKIVLAEELVSKGEGSGLVHIAPGHGLEDYLVGKRYGIPIFSPIDQHGDYTHDAGEYNGLHVPGEANERVIADLEALGAVVYLSKLRHSYPHCWRCDTKLIFMATRQWFINIQKVKKKILSENSKVSWHPVEAQRWEEEVLQGSPDWTISRQRYWGVPMPIWECGCGEITVIGSLGELRGLATDGAAVDALSDIHRPHIDGIRVRCRKCGSEVSRVKDVLDVWFDSGVAYRASLTSEQFEKLFPMDFILEGVDQLRAWFSYQIKVSVIVNGKRPFDNVVTHGMMLGQDGGEMHKKLGNYVPLPELMKTTTADSFRLWCTSHAPQLDLYFNTEKINEANKTVKLLYNISNLYSEYSDAASYKPGKVKRAWDPSSLPLEDAWILSRMNSCIRSVTQSLDNYEIYKGAAAIRNFVTEDFSRIYLRMAKKRILYSNRRAAKATLGIINYLLFNTLILLAPYMPFSTEKVYLDNYAKKSVFLEDWPRFNTKLINADAEKDFAIAMDAITAILYSREKENLKLRQPLTKATVETTDDSALAALQRLAYVIEDYTNIKHLEVRKAQSLNAEIKPNFGRIGPDFKDKAAAVAQALRACDANKMLEEIDRNGYYQLHTDMGAVQVTQDHFTVIKRLQNEDAVQFRHGVAYIDREISRELRDEAIIREFERAVQVARKELQLKKIDRIALHYLAGKDITDVISANARNVKKAVNAKEIRGAIEPGSEAKEFDINGSGVRISIRKL